MRPIALTIAGSDSSGGAGLQADLKTFHQFGVYGASVVTLLTAQNTLGVRATRLLDDSFVSEQLDAVLADFTPNAAKAGAMGHPLIAEAIADAASGFEFPLIVDPVMISKHGDSLVDEDIAAIIRRQLCPRAFIVTPNVFEAEALTGKRITDLKSMEHVALAIFDLGCRNVLITGGRHGHDAVDMLCVGGQCTPISEERIQTSNTHGTGCTFSAALTAAIALGYDVITAVQVAKAFITEAIHTNPGLGHGFGPVNHFVTPPLPQAMFVESDNPPRT